MDVFTFSKRGRRGGNQPFSKGHGVSKASHRPEAYGTLDEASSAMGLAKALTGNTTIRDMILTVQEDLLLLGAQLSCESADDTTYRIGTERTARLEKWIEELQREVPMPRQFVYPGDNPASAAIDLSRTVVRRAERRVIALRGSGENWTIPRSIPT